tara:strand:+ start:3979 stop:4527 length:549 start_codon:yes stop_codon:yes gene_type:complete
MKRSSNQIFDELLVLRCQDKDQTAVGLLWKRWQPKVLSWSYGFLKDQDQAYEIAQESWVSIIKGIHKLKDPALFRFWAYKIVQRRAADWIKQQQRERNSVYQFEVENVSPSEAEPQDQMELMLVAIHDLPEQHQQVLRLFYLEKTPIKIIAQILDKPEGTVKSSLYHAREQLKKKLKKESYE